MRIGVDVDGVLANFVEGFTKLTIEITGRNLFPSTFETGEAPCWDWPQYYGYTDEEMTLVSNAVTHSTNFWRELSPFLPNVLSLLIAPPELHDLYLVTNRFGFQSKRQTERWLETLFHQHAHAPFTLPTVLISSHKGLIARALELEAYIDDKPENCIDVMTQSPQTWTFLLNRAYNRNEGTGIDIARVSSLDEMFMRLEYWDQAKKKFSLSLLKARQSPQESVKSAP